MSIFVDIKVEQCLEKFLNKTGFDEDCLSLVQSPSEIKTVYPPGEIKILFGHLKFLLKQRKECRVFFKFKEKGSKDLITFNAKVTTVNVMHLPRLVKLAKSDILLYDLSVGIFSL